MADQLESLTPGMAIVFGGNQVTTVSEELAAAFVPGDLLLVVQSTGELIHVPSSVSAVADRAVGSAYEAFGRMGEVDDAAITAFYEAFAARLADDATFRPIAEANAADVAAARDRGRSTTRLELTPSMRADMIAGLGVWRDMASPRDRLIERVVHDGWEVELRAAGLGPIGFVFEGRPNVFADATGVIRSGNTVVFRIGSDALGTARAIVDHALEPARAEAGLPPGVASLVDSADRAAGHAMFSDRRLALAVARGSGPAVAQLGAVARQAGIPVSLHGTGGAWLVTGRHADAEAFAAAAFNSLDRKVCNTLNTCCILAERAEELVPVFLDVLERAGQRRGTMAKLHVEVDSHHHIPMGWYTDAPISRASGTVMEPRAEMIAEAELWREWEWEDSPEVSLVVVDSVDEAVALCNAHSPRFVASLISDDPAEHDAFYRSIDAPFVGNGFTRWVDGQYALGRPELGLSNWQDGRLFGRGGVLSGDGVFTVRTRVIQTDPRIGR